MDVEGLRTGITALACQDDQAIRSWVRSLYLLFPWEKRDLYLSLMAYDSTSETALMAAVVKHVHRESKMQRALVAVILFAVGCLLWMASND